jgi:mRNA interferase MazF
VISPLARRGEVWLADLDPVRGNELAGIRPVLIISVTRIGASRGGLAIVVPIITTDRTDHGAVRISAGEGGLRRDSYATPIKVRSIARERLISRWGVATTTTVDEVANQVRIAIGLEPPARL